MSETAMYNVSSSPHFRQDLTVGRVMQNVVIALMPATVFGIIRYGFHAFMVIALCILTTTVTEYIFDKIVKKPNTLNDWSAVVTGLLLAISLPPAVPFYIPVIGGMFAILVAKCFFGGIGKNWINPALAARCFLLISFGTQMTGFAVDGTSGATPLAQLQAGETINITNLYLGTVPGVIGGSAICLLIGGLYLWVTDGITLHIPAAVIISFTLFVAAFGGHGFDGKFLLANLFGGGILMGAFFMATDPVTSPITTKAQVFYGIIIGILAGLFRVFGSSPDSVSYVIIISNMLTPFLDKIPPTKPLGYKNQGANGEYKKAGFPKAAVNLLAITFFAGLILSGVYAMTRDKIAVQQMNKNAASFREVLADAESFDYDDSISKAVTEHAGTSYNEASFGRTEITDCVVGKDAGGNVVGYVISVTNHEGHEGDIAMSVGIDTEGTVTGIAFTSLQETAGMGMKADEPDWKAQFKGAKTNEFTLNKSGTAEPGSGEVNVISGATVTSKAVLHAVNAALGFYADNIA